jgi:hypothetical protein
MKRLTHLSINPSTAAKLGAVLLLAASLSACVVAPLGHHRGGGHGGHPGYGAVVTAPVVVAPPVVVRPAVVVQPGGRYDARPPREYRY